MNYLYVPKCLSCGERVDINVYLCDVCMLNWRYERSYVNYDSLFLAYYDKKDNTIARSIILKIKDSNEKRYYNFFADEFHEKLTNYKSYIITNVPRSRDKIAEIGHDQAKLLAKAIANKMKMQYQELLSHKGDTEQKLLSFGERRSNAENSYDIKRKRRSKLHGMKILLADDVTTSGATLDKCKRVLIENGADNVETITICKSK